MHDHQQHLEAALGYLHLGMPEEAREELDLIPGASASHPVVLRARAFIHTETCAWEDLRQVAERLVSLAPGDSQHWIWLAYATRRCHSIMAAEKILLDASQLHAGEAMIHFNLACYAAQTDRISLARARLSEAIRLDPGVTKLAVDDPDLRPLW